MSPAIDEPDPPGWLKRCFLGELLCTKHPETMPGLDREPSFGMCAVGHPARYLWTIPRDGKRYCRDHLRLDYLRMRYPGPS